MVGRIGAAQGVLDIAENRIHPSKLGALDSGSSAAHHHRLMNAARGGDAMKAGQPIGGVDPNSWTPDPLGRRYPPCRDQDRRIRRSFGARWLSWCEPDGVRKSCHESLSRRRRRSATGSCKPSVTRGVAGMGQVPRSERRCVAFAERFVGCAKNEISWQKPRLVAVHRRHILANDDRRARLQARRADRTLRILTTRDLMVSMIDEGLLDIAEADSIKDEWAARHRFRLKLDSFRDFYP